MLIRFVISVGLTVCVAGTSFAAPAAGNDKAALQQQCSGDFTTFCGDLPPDDAPATQACFEKNMSKLSPGCQGAIRNYRQGKKD